MEPLSNAVFWTYHTITGMGQETGLHLANTSTTLKLRDKSDNLLSLIVTHSFIKVAFKRLIK